MNEPWKCQECGWPISEGVAHYSLTAYFKKPLCMECQKKERGKTKTGKMVNAQIEKDYRNGGNGSNFA